MATCLLDTLIRYIFMWILIINVVAVTKPISHLNCIHFLQGIQYPIPSTRVEAVICFFVGSAMRYTTGQSLSIYDHFDALRKVVSRMLQPHVAPSFEPGRYGLTHRSGRGYGPRDFKVGLQVSKINYKSVLGQIFCGHIYPLTTAVCKLLSGLTQVTIWTAIKYI